MPARPYNNVDACYVVGDALAGLSTAGLTFQVLGCAARCQPPLNHVNTGPGANSQHEQQHGSRWKSRYDWLRVPAPTPSLSAVDQLLNGQGNWSLLAPTDTAFFGSLQAVGINNITRFLANTSLALDVVDNHIVIVDVRPQSSALFVCFILHLTGTAGCQFLGVIPGCVDGCSLH